ncbi:MAG: hypothetical protein A2283_10135 [Lentisphaerae bacterium RIFOXYA12_FULL_48_11]|nr:MAG: hypothetical protein A2283_10135 [Lentisphaerae bacterium RIFOXYA12_FULL_48_11]
MIYTIIIYAAAGSVVSSILACIPGLHVYNVMGLLLLSGCMPGCPEIIVPLFTGMIVGYAVMSTLPSVFLAAPDESALFIVLPGQKYLMCGRGYEGSIITACGSMAGLFLLLLLAAPLAPALLSVAHTVFQPHLHWILWCVICFMLMSEWPKGGVLGDGGFAKFIDGWKATGAGLVTFFLSGLLGFILLYRSPIPSTVAFQNIMPAFVGLFTLPWLLLNIVSGVSIPDQKIDSRSNLGAVSFLRGVFAGGLGGGFAAFFPVVSGGVGGFLSGHATALRDDKAFLVSQGVSKLVYYAGGFLLLFVPGLGIGRGGGSWLMRGIYVPGSYHDYYLAMASMAIAGAVSLLMVGPLSWGMIKLIGKSSFRFLSFVSLLLVFVIVFAVTGWRGEFVMLVAAGIGLIPVLLGSRRMNCLGVILLPMACNMSGCGAKVAGWMGLL